jgi:LuxR family maltose regulon positive regulatory protein
MEAVMANEKPLSRSQFEVLRLVNLGLSNQEIAQRLRISVGMTKWHLHEILRKLAVRNRTAAAAKARSLGLL